VPTTRPRHTITETPPVQEALDELRAKLGQGETIDFAELVTLGARAKARRMSDDDAAKRTARARFAEQIRTRSLPYEIDIAAAEEVKYLGLTATYE
jgi:hypothetical protein